MAFDTYTPLFSEILEKVAKLKTKKDKIEYLQKYNTDVFAWLSSPHLIRRLCGLLPEGDVPYTPNEAPEGTEHTVLSHEARKLFNFIKGGNGQLTQNKRETMFVQMLEGLHADEAKVDCCCKGQEVASGL